MLRQEVLPAEGPVELRVHDVAGRLVRTLASRRAIRRSAVLRTFTWDGRTDDGREAPTGVYFVRGAAPNLRVTLRVARVL